MSKPKAKWNKINVREMLEKSDKALIRGLLAIYEGQTPDEQTVGQTVEDNGIGFNGVDAEFLTAMVVSYQNYKRLTEGQLRATRKAMLKYSGQLARIANAKESQDVVQ